MLTTDFVTAGNAIFTVSNNKGDHYTYRVSRVEANGNRPAAWFVSLLTGPNNLDDYTYLGMLDCNTGAVRLTKASRLGDDSTPVRVVRWAFGLIWGEKSVPEGYAVHHEGRCGRCGRPLTVPSSIETGLGPDCAAKIAAA